jgi:hypothetical protein
MPEIVGLVTLRHGNLGSAKEHPDWLTSHAESHLLATFLAVGRGFKGGLAIRRGELEGGIENLQGCLQELHAARYKLLATSFSFSLVEGLAATGRFAQGIALIDERIRLDQADQARSYLPELLRLKGRILLSTPEARVDEVEMCFTNPFNLSRRQGARAWELRSAIDLAKLLAAQGNIDGAHELLRPVFEQFVEGLGTADLKAAERLLVTLR